MATYRDRKPSRYREKLVLSIRARTLGGYFAVSGIECLLREVGDRTLGGEEAYSVIHQCIEQSKDLFPELRASAYQTLSLQFDDTHAH